MHFLNINAYQIQKKLAEQNPVTGDTTEQFDICPLQLAKFPWAGNAMVVDDDRVVVIQASLEQHYVQPQFSGITVQNWVVRALLLCNHDCDCRQDRAA